MSLPLQRLDVPINLNPRRVLLRPYGNPATPHGAHIIARVLAMPESEVRQVLASVLAEFGARHPDVPGRLQERLGALRDRVPSDLSPDRRALLGACFSCEYSIEAAALFNPSMVAHPDQSGLGPGELRFVLSLRCTGEGHISSLGFATGVLSATAEVRLDPPGRYAVEPIISQQNGPDYQAHFPPERALNEQVLFPVTEAQRNGIEDVRLVACEGRYYGTYTAYDGRSILPQLIETDDFRSYRFIALQGAAVRNKGMALFPRQVNGLYTMLGRQDGETLSLMVSEQVHRWEEHRPLVGPRFAWELVQIGNCGSPLETERGWLVLTHGVGPMRKYCLGAFLLDRDRPDRLIASLETPLIAPDASEREGYVPNVVYSCGSLIHAGQLIIPYAMSDSACRFARIELKALLDAMV